MKRRLVILAVTLLVVAPSIGSARGVEPGQTAPAAVNTPHDAAAHDQTAPAEGHDHAAMLAAQAAATPDDIDVLLKKMQNAKGQARINVMAALVTKLAAEHQASKHGGAPASGGMCGGHGNASGGGHEMSCPMCAAHMKTAPSK